MKKLSLAAIIVTVSISLAGCTNSETASNGNKTNTESTTQIAVKVVQKIIM